MVTLTEDQKAIAFATLLPIATGAVGVSILGKDKEAMFHWWHALKKPSYWCAEKRNKEQEICLVTSLNCLAGLPMVYATYKVWKEGGFEYADTRLALGSYAFLHAVGILSVFPRKNRDLKGTFVSTAAMFGASCVMSHLYHKINKEAGYLTIPFTVLFGFYTIFAYQVYDMNKGIMEK